MLVNQLRGKTFGESPANADVDGYLSDLQTEDLLGQRKLI